MPLAPLPVLPAGPVAAVACCSPQTGAPITELDAVALAATLKALADPMRLRLLSLIAAREGGEACICDLVGPVGLSQPTVSHHMKVLTDAGLVRREKRGVWVHYAVIPGVVDDLAAHLGTHLTADR